MKLKKFMNFASAVIMVILIFGMSAEAFVSAVKYTDIEAIEELDFPTFEEWHTSEYSSEISAFSDKSTRGKFIAPIEPIKKDESDWIEISNREDLEKIALDMDGKYYLSNDIDLGDTEWSPIGNSTDKFKGIFDGQGYVIKNLKIGTNETPKIIQYAGLFGYVENATIKNVGLEETCINILYEELSYAGGIFGYGTGATVSNCYNTGDISAVADDSLSHAGGIFGYGAGAAVSSCYNTGDISVKSSNYSYAGGIFSYGTGAAVSNCYNTGDVSATAADSLSHAGGIFGYGDTGTAVSNCYNTGNISAAADDSLSHAGGIFGAGSGTDIVRCYNKGTISVSATNSIYVGGIFGFGRNPAIRNCYNTGDISVIVNSAYFIGSIFGGNDGSAVISSCYWNIESKQLVNSVAPSQKKGIGTAGTDNTTPLTSDEMKQKSSFVDFDFDTVWDLNEDINEGYPFFRSNLYVVLDFTLLFEKIEAALEEADDVIVSTTDGSELWEKSTNKFWVTAEAKNKFYQALESSYKVITEAISQSEIDLAVENLDKAIRDFEEEKTTGTGVLVDYQILIEKIDKAIEAKADVITSENGSELSALTEYNWWVTKDVMDNFNSAIMSALNTLTSINQTEICDAADELNIAIEEFLSQRKRGIGKFATNYAIQGNFISDVSLKTNRLTFASNFYSENEEYDLIVNIYTSSGKLLEDGDNVGTGMAVKIIIAGQIAGEFEAVIHGDVTGDGNADIEDAKIFLESLVGNTILTDACARAVEDYNNSDSAIKNLRAFLNFVMNRT